MTNFFRNTVATALICVCCASGAHAAGSRPAGPLSSAGATIVEKGVGANLPDGLGWEIGLAVAGGAVVLVTGGLASPFVAAGTSLIGSMIGGTMGLSGAAATSAGLAALGGGSVAAGGFGMAGGAAVATAGIGTAWTAAITAASSLLPDDVRHEINSVKQNLKTTALDKAKETWTELRDTIR